jgi:hypothetical protein
MKQLAPRLSRDRARNRLQFGLGSMISLVICSAVFLAGLQSLGVVFGVIATAITILIMLGVRLKDWSWRLVAWTWATALAISLQLSWSYAWTLPLFGVVPGLPDDFVLRTTEGAGISVVIIGGACALGSLMRGSFIQRVICLPPAVLLLLLLYSILSSVLF